MPTLPLLKPEKNANDSPHVVLLGAGASLASFPNGDRNARLLPLMRNFVEVVGLNDLLEEHGIDYQEKNFEELYSDLHFSKEHSNLVRRLETRIREYFSRMELPDSLTLYDEIVLSLRKEGSHRHVQLGPVLATRVQTQLPPKRASSDRLPARLR